MHITTKFVNEANPGKKFGSIVDTEDNRYPVAAALVGRFVKGGTYDVTIKEDTWDGKPVRVILSVSATQPPQTAPSPARQALNGTDRWWLPFVSNQVAHAIAAGLIKEPHQLGAWAKAAKETVIATDAL